MATTLKIIEAEPDLVPPFENPTESVLALTAVAWARIEAWITRRWVSRAITFIVEGPGEWCAPITPYTHETGEVWFEGAWTSVSLIASPLGGFELSEVGPYRFTGTAGDGTTPPAAVLEAYRRLATYMVEADGIRGGLISEEDNPDVRRVQYSSASTAARAIQNSGAADLLRPWRRLGAN